MFPGSKWVIVRKDLDRIKATVLPTFYQMIPDSFTETMPTQHNQWEWRATNGSVIKFFAENIEKDPELKRFRGLEYDGIGLEEMDVSKKTFYMALQRCGTWKMTERKEAREKGLTTPPKICLGTSNPQTGWVKTELYDKSNEGTLNKAFYVLRARIYDNPHIEPEYIENLRKTLPYIEFLKMVEGDWSVNENEHPFFYEYNSDKHVKECEIIDDEILWNSFDFNIDPTTVVLGQKIVGVGLFIYDCIQVKGGTEKLCSEIEWVKEHPAGLNVTGDHSGHSGSSVAGVVEGGTYNTDFGIIKEVLELNAFDIVHTKKRNANHEYSRKVCNRVFQALPIYIHPKAQVLLTDLQIAQATDQGKLKKDRENFKMDACDAFRYLINAWFPQGFADIQDFKNTL